MFILMSKATNSNTKKKSLPQLCFIIIIDYTSLIKDSHSISFYLCVTQHIQWLICIDNWNFIPVWYVYNEHFAHCINFSICAKWRQYTGILFLAICDRHPMDISLEDCYPLNDKYGTLSSFIKNDLLNNIYIWAVAKSHLLPYRNKETQT